MKICLYDRSRQHCSGCGRTLDEIAGWASLSAEERSRIMADLPGRLVAEHRPGKV